MIIGITGRVGVGKSTAVSYIVDNYDCVIIDLDLIGHDLLEEDKIKNRCIIQFGNQIVSENNIKKSIYPNPINEYFSIQSEINTFELFDITQNKVMQKKINGHQVTIDRKNIKSGVYFYKIKNIDNSIEYGKLIFN